MHKRERKNHQLLVTKGEIPEDRQAENDTAQKAYDKLLTSVSTLAVSLGRVEVFSFSLRPIPLCYT